MQLTLFIKKSGNVHANCSKTVRSLKHEDMQLNDIIFIDKLSDIIYGKIKSEWYIVLYDNEYMQSSLVEALIIAGGYPGYDVFSCYKADYSDGKNPIITICPRMFRKDIKLEVDRLYPILPVKMETILDGWVLAHDRNACQLEATEDLSVFA